MNKLWPICDRLNRKIMAYEQKCKTAIPNRSLFCILSCSFCLFFVCLLQQINEIHAKHILYPKRLFKMTSLEYFYIHFPLTFLLLWLWKTFMDLFGPSYLRSMPNNCPLNLETAEKKMYDHLDSFFFSSEKKHSLAQ